MKVRAQVAMVMNLDKCIGCHTCSITCKNVWTSREGMEYVWWTTNGGSEATIRRTTSALTYRGLALWKTKPSASAPAVTAARASSGFVIPQILILEIILAGTICL